MSAGYVTTKKTSTTSTTTDELISHLTPIELHKEEGDNSQTAPEESPLAQVLWENKRRFLRVKRNLKEILDNTMTLATLLKTLRRC